MKRLTVDQILIPGAKMVVKKIDFDDPANANLKQLFEETKERQEKLLRIKNLPFENLTITI